MNRLLVSLLSLALGGVLLAPPAAAQVGKGLSGPHYNLNIIGVPRDKTVPDMTGSDRHTLFVPLDNDAVSRQVRIYYLPGTEFRVLDGNCTDDNECTIMVPGDPTNQVCYDVYATALGKPKGNAVVAAQCIIEDLLGECTDALLQSSFALTRMTGKPKRENITKMFRASGCIDANGSGLCDADEVRFSDVWIFNLAQLVEYFWDYDNNGLKLMQVRFYVSRNCGSITTGG
jgi:hypothetical protein